MASVGFVLLARRHLARAAYRRASTRRHDWNRDAIDQEALEHVFRWRQLFDGGNNVGFALVDEFLARLCRRHGLHVSERAREREREKRASVHTELVDACQISVELGVRSERAFGLRALGVAAEDSFRRRQGARDGKGRRGNVGIEQCVGSLIEATEESVVARTS